MKQFLLMPCLVVVLTLQAQKKDVSLYGFSQGISKGIRETTVDEKGQIYTEKKGDSKTLLLFVESPAGMKLKITELWINGEKYLFEIAPEKTPVILNSGLHMPGQKETELIPETMNEIIRIIPYEKTTIAEKNRRSIAKKKPVVVFYTVKGKSCYLSLDKMEILPDLVNE